MRRPSARRLTALARGRPAPCPRACGSDDDRPGGRRRLDLVIYSGRNEKLVGPILEKLEKAVGTKVEVRYGDSAELAAQLLEEGDRTKADVFFSQDARRARRAGQGGPARRRCRRPMLDKVARGATAATTATGSASSGRVPGDRLQPGPGRRGRGAGQRLRRSPSREWKGKVGFAPTNASFQAFVTGMRVLEGDDATRDVARGHEGQRAKTYDNNIAILDAVEAGEVSPRPDQPLLLVRAGRRGGRRTRSPARLKFLPGGDPGALVNVAGVGVLQGRRPGRDAPSRLVDYLLGRGGARPTSPTRPRSTRWSRACRPRRGLPPLDSLQSPDDRPVRAGLAGGDPGDAPGRRAGLSRGPTMTGARPLQPSATVRRRTRAAPAARPRPARRPPARCCSSRPGRRRGRPAAARVPGRPRLGARPRHGLGRRRRERTARCSCSQPRRSPAVVVAACLVLGVLAGLADRAHRAARARGLVGAGALPLAVPSYVAAFAWLSAVPGLGRLHRRRRWS